MFNSNKCTYGTHHKFNVYRPSDNGSLRTHVYYLKVDTSCSSSLSVKTVSDTIAFDHGLKEQGVIGGWSSLFESSAASCPISYCQLMKPGCSESFSSKTLKMAASSPWAVTYTPALIDFYSLKYANSYCANQDPNAAEQSGTFTKHQCYEKCKGTNTCIEFTFGKGA